MSGRIENLGDYNKARLMLQKRGGDLSALIKDIKNVGAREALPRQISVGLLLGAAIGAGGTFAARKISARIKTHRELRDKELEEKLKTVLSDDDDPDKPEMEEPPC